MNRSDQDDERIPANLDETVEASPQTTAPSDSTTDRGANPDDASQPGSPRPDEQPFVAKLVSASESANSGMEAADSTVDGVNAEQPEIRVGSPFRIDPEDLDQIDSSATPGQVGAGVPEAAYADFGPFLYTAMGASAAAVVVLLFAAAGAWWFPTGGALVAILGTVLSIIGVFSTRRFRYAAIATLPLHMVLFFVSYARSLS